MAFLAGAAAAALLAAVVLAVTGALSGDDPAESGASLPEGTVEISTIPVKNPSGLAIGDGKVFVSSYERDIVTPIDERTARPGKPIETGDGPAGLAVDGESLWISQTSAGNIGRVDLKLGRLVGAPTPLSSGDGDVIALGEGAVWATNPFEGRGEVGRIDRRTGKVTKRIRVRDGLNGDLAVGEGAVWVVNKERPSVTTIDGGTAKVLGEPITVGNPVKDFGGDVEVGAGSVWVTSPDDNTVSRIDPRSRKVTDKIPVPTGVGDDLAFGLGFVWVIDSNSSLIRIDPASGSIEGAPLPASPFGGQELEVGRDALWLNGSSDAGTVLRIAP